MAHACPCCGYLTMPEQRGSYSICPICAWEDDLLQYEEPNRRGGANSVSLNEARSNFQRLRVSDPDLKGMARPPRPNEVPPGGPGGATPGSGGVSTPQ